MSKWLELPPPAKVRLARPCTPTRKTLGETREAHQFPPQFQSPRQVRVQVPKRNATSASIW